MFDSRPPASLTVVLADDHPLMRDGVREVLTERGVIVLAEVGDAPSAVEATLRHRPDVCLLDIDMPGDGLAAAHEIYDLVPETAIVMLTVSDDERDLLAAVRAGAVGYLLKDSDPDRLAAALRTIVSGEALLPRALMSHVLEQFGTGTGRRRFGLRMPRRAALSDREWDVLELMYDELSTRDVAVRLAVSPVTVRRHLSSAVTKLGVKDRHAALALIRDVNVGGTSGEIGVQRPARR